MCSSLELPSKQNQATNREWIHPCPCTQQPTMVKHLIPKMTLHVLICKYYVQVLKCPPNEEWKARMGL